MELSKSEEEYKILSTQYWTRWYKQKDIITPNKLKRFMSGMKELQFEMQVIMNPTRTKSKTIEWEKPEGIFKEIDKQIKSNLV